MVARSEPIISNQNESNRLICITITMVVGGQETVLGFGSGDLNANYASKGASDAVEPVMTCYFMMWHHSEFPRKYVIPVADGVKAVHQFLDSGDLPT